MAKKESKSFILRLQWIITEALRKAKRLPKMKKGNNNEETKI